MISTEIYIEDYKLDLLQDISTEFSYSIDDIVDFGSKNTSFSKTINISGTAINNKIFGFVFDLGNANLTDDELPNVNYNFNASKSAQCRIFIDKIQVFKGTLRILEIVIDKNTISIYMTNGHTIPTYESIKEKIFRSNYEPLAWNIRGLV